MARRPRSKMQQRKNDQKKEMGLWGAGRAHTLLQCHPPLYTRAAAPPPTMPNAT
jgi:hypothetical protein